MAVDPSMYNRGRDGKGLLLHELIDLMDSDDKTYQSIAICPPFELADAETHRDSDLSDEEVEGNIDHLPGRILRAEVDVRYDDNDEVYEHNDVNNEPVNTSMPSTSTAPTKKGANKRMKSNKSHPSAKYPSTSKAKKTKWSANITEVNTSMPSTSTAPTKKGANKRTKSNKSHPSAKYPSTSKAKETKWSANITEVNSVVPKFDDTVFHPNAEDLLKETVHSPFEAMKSFFTQELLQHIVRETNRYASQKLVHNFNVSEQEILTFIGVMLLSGYHSLPYRRLYWSSEPDVHCEPIADAIRRNRFDDIMAHLHLANNETNDGSDNLYKGREFIDMLNASFKQVSAGSTVSIDESIIPYYGRHGLKQFIKGKPIRFGYKLWVAADSSGRILHAEPYCGASTRLAATGLGQGGNVVLGLADYIEANKAGTIFYFDNLFTSVGLLQKLNEKKIGGTGTLRENRCNPQMKLPDKQAFKKTPRGSLSSSGTDNILAVRWNDNNVVTVLSNCENMYPMKKSNRYSRTEKSRIQVNIPNPIDRYNKCMGGVDLSDQFVASYRSRIRSKKWWWPLFGWGVDICCVQGWLLYRRLGHNIPLLSFRRECAIFLLKSFGQSRKTAGLRSSLQFSPALEKIRKDRTDHIIEKGISKYRRCKICGNRTTYICRKCDVPLHPEDCFKTFHK